MAQNSCVLLIAFILCQSLLLFGYSIGENNLVTDETPSQSIDSVTNETVLKSIDLVTDKTPSKSIDLVTNETPSEPTNLATAETPSESSDLVEDKTSSESIDSATDETSSKAIGLVKNEKTSKSLVDKVNQILNAYKSYDQGYYDYGYNYEQSYNQEYESNYDYNKDYFYKLILELVHDYGKQTQGANTPTISLSGLSNMKPFAIPSFSDLIPSPSEVALSLLTIFPSFTGPPAVGMLPPTSLNIPHGPGAVVMNQPVGGIPVMVDLTTGILQALSEIIVLVLGGQLRLPVMAEFGSIKASGDASDSNKEVAIEKLRQCLRKGKTDVRRGKVNDLDIPTRLIAIMSLISTLEIHGKSSVPTETFNKLYAIRDELAEKVPNRSKNVLISSLACFVQSFQIFSAAKPNTY